MIKFPLLMIKQLILLLNFIFPTVIKFTLDSSNSCKPSTIWCDFSHTNHFAISKVISSNSCFIEISYNIFTEIENKEYTICNFCMKKATNYFKKQPLAVYSNTLNFLQNDQNEYLYQMTIEGTYIAPIFNTNNSFYDMIEFKNIANPYIYHMLYLKTPLFAVNFRCISNLNELQKIPRDILASEKTLKFSHPSISISILKNLLYVTFFTLLIIFLSTCIYYKHYNLF
ncbi:hypothetical protein NUSPORA_02070 [Nucleospora cyclopteri]